jgi:ribosome-associated translation inhibitor RaiA
MKSPLQITVRDMEPSMAVEASVRAHAQKLERLCPRLTSCHVTIDSPHRHKTHGRHFRVRIEIGVPGNRFVVDRDPSGDWRNEDAYTALSAAFEHAARQLSDGARRSRSKRHKDDDILAGLSVDASLREESPRPLDG